MSLSPVKETLDGNNALSLPYFKTVKPAIHLMLQDNASQDRIVTALPSRTHCPAILPKPASFLLCLFSDSRLWLRCGCLDRCLGNLCWSGCRLLSQSLLPQVQSPCAESLELGMNLLPLSGKLVRMFRFGPKVGDSKAVIEVGAEVVHDANGEHDIHAKLVADQIMSGKGYNRGQS